LERGEGVPIPGEKNERKGPADCFREEKRRRDASRKKAATCKKGEHIIPSGRGEKKSKKWKGNARISQTSLNQEVEGKREVPLTLNRGGKGKEATPRKKKAGITSLEKESITLRGRGENRWG